MNEDRKNRLRQKLIRARHALTMEYGEFALPLWEMIFVATEDVCRASTNGRCIYFDPNWLQKLNEDALQFILAHELMHIVLEHIDRENYYRGDRFHFACDIVANSHIKAMGMEWEKLPGIGTIYTQTFFPRIEGRELTAWEAMGAVPFDPSACKPGQRRRYMIDSEEWWDRKEDRGQSGVILLKPGEEDGTEIFIKPEKSSFLIPTYVARDEKPPLLVDIMTVQTEEETPKILHSVWNIEASDALQNLRDQKERQESAGNYEGFRERIWNRSARATLNWRELLQRFVQTEICDYSFMPPDRRMTDTEFFLPDFNEAQEVPMKIWFLVDTSASVTDEMLDTVYGEIYHALRQMGDGIRGYLGFFDTRMYEPGAFGDVTALSAIVPKGGGGTNFSCVFDWLKEQGDLPDSLVIFTDGQGEYPEEYTDIPVLWLFTDRNASAPWGASAFVSLWNPS